MLNEEIMIFPNDNQAQQTEELPFARYVRSTLSAALSARGHSYLSLGSLGGYDILTLPPDISEAYQWRSLYCRPTKQAVNGKKKHDYGLLCIGEAIGDELRDAMRSAGLGTRFTVISSSEYLKIDGMKRRRWVFNPLTTAIDCQLQIAWAAAKPDWQSFGEAIEGMRVVAALRL